MKTEYKLKEAAYVGNNKLIKKIKSKNKNIDLSFDHNYLLRMAVVKNNFDLVCYLLHSGDISDIKTYDNFCLKKATVEGYYQILDVLLSKNKETFFSNEEFHELLEMCNDEETRRILNIKFGENFARCFLAK